MSSKPTDVSGPTARDVPDLQPASNRDRPAAPVQATATPTAVPRATSNVQCYVRIKPGNLDASVFRVKESGEIVLRPPRLQPSSQSTATTHSAAISSNAQSVFLFALDGTLAQACTQEDVFTTVAAPVLDAALNGVSGAVLAYGQTGSGKTYTMGGGKGGYKERGVIPRALSYVCKKAEAARQSAGRDVYSLRLSYCEIYNERIVDLLRDSGSMSGGGTGTGTGGGPGEDVDMYQGSAAARQQLEIREDSKGHIFIPGLRTPLLSGEGDALSLLFEGEANRALAEHALNAGSSRSHAVLTVHIEQSMTMQEATGAGRSVGGGSIRRPRPAASVGSGEDGEEDSSGIDASKGEPMVQVVSKLHLVDLAGSERVGKTGSSGTTLTEAGYINSSLSILEHCVVALLEAERTHIPYRSSKLTHMLKEALGGKCMTRLIAAVWPDSEHVEESLATLRFAARMMRVKTTPARTIAEGAGGGGGAEKVRMVARYEAELAALRQELALHDAIVSSSGGANRGRVHYGPLSLAELQGMGDMLRAWVQAGQRGADSGTEEQAEVDPTQALPTVRHLHAALHILRDMCLQAGGAQGQDKGQSAEEKGEIGTAAGSRQASATSAAPMIAPADSHSPAGPSAAAGSSQAEAMVGVVDQPAPGGAVVSRARAQVDNAAAVEAWRATPLGQELTLSYAAARAAVREKKAAWSTLAAGVNEAKREIDKVMEDIGRVREGGARREVLMSALQAAKVAYKSKYTAMQEVKGEMDYCSRQAEEVGAKIAGEVNKYMAGQGGPPSPPPVRVLNSREAYEAGVKRVEERVAAVTTGGSTGTGTGAGKGSPNRGGVRTIGRGKG